MAAQSLRPRNTIAKFDCNGGGALRRSTFKNRQYFGLEITWREMAVKKRTGSAMLTITRLSGRGRGTGLRTDIPWPSPTGKYLQYIVHAGLPW